MKIRHNKLLLGSLIFILLAEAFFTGILPVTKGYLFGELGNKSPAIWFALGCSFLNFLAIDFFQCFKAYFVTRVSLWYRALRTKFVVREQRTDSDITNIPQRIQEDIKLSYHSRITVWCEYLVSGLILVQLFLLNIRVPLLVIAALIYAAVSIFIAIRFNPRLTKAEIDVQQYEANFRSSLVENVKDMSHLLPTNAIVQKVAKIRMEYLLFTKLQLSLVIVLPYLVLLPSYIADKIDFGTLMQHQSTFSLIVVNASVLIQLYMTLIQGHASDKRVKELL